MEIIFKFGLNGGSRKMCVFQWKTGLVSETVRNTPRLLLITNRPKKVAYFLLNDMKIIHLK